MIELRPLQRPRPILATVIALWEVLIVVLAIGARVAIRVLHAARHTAHGTHSVAPSSPLHTAGLILASALAIAGAIALWQMHRSAFIFLAARCVVQLALLILSLTNIRPNHSSLPFFIIDTLALALNAAIAWYAFHITSSKPQLQPTATANPEIPSKTQDVPLTTSQFYLSQDHKKTIIKD